MRADPSGVRAERGAPPSQPSPAGGREVRDTRSRFAEVVGRAHLPALDGLRAVAVALVIVGHANYPIRGVPADLGVSAFFVLSGFLITRLLIREWVSHGGVSLRNFYLRRTMRIFPAYYAFLALSFLLDRRQGQHWDPSLLASALTYTVNYFNALHHHPSTSVAHAWSLAVEEQFYLLWPVLFLVLARRGRREIVAGVAALAIAAAGWRSFLALHAHADVAYLYNAFDTRFDNLAIGCVMALIADSPSVARAVDRVARRGWYAFATIGLLLASRIGAPEAYHYSLGFTVDAILIAVLIAQLLVVHDSAPWRWLQHPVTRYLGTISYPMYLYHAWGASIGRHLPLHGEAAAFAGAGIATVGLAMGSYHVIEKPFLRLKRRFEPDRPRTSSEASSIVRADLATLPSAASAVRESSGTAHPAA